MVKSFGCGMLESNVHIYSNHGVAMIVDCGAPVSTVLPYITENNLAVKFIVLTHGHVDHVAFLSEYKKTFSEAKIVCHEAEKAVLYDPLANLSPYFGSETVYDCSYTTVKHGDTIDIGDAKLTVISAPGHTPGCICLYCKEEKIMFTGDVLFSGSYGRTDFKYGDINQMLKSLKKLLKMDGDIIFYPGHYAKSSIKENTYLIFS